MSLDKSSSESLVEVDGCYEVAAILDKKVMKKDGRLKNFYLIYWKGYPDESTHTWEPTENLRAVKDMIYEFEKKRRQQAPKDASRESEVARKVKQAMVPEDQHSKQKGETKDSEEGAKRQRKLRKLDISSPQKQMDKSNEASGRQNKKNEVKKKLEGKGNTKGKDANKSAVNEYSNKRANPFQQQQQSIYNPPPTQPAKAKPSNQYGMVVNHSYHNGQMYYEVQIMGKEGSVKGTAVLIASKIKDDCPSRIADYLEKYVIELEEWNRLNA